MLVTPMEKDYDYLIQIDSKGRWIAPSVVQYKICASGAIVDVPPGEGDGAYEIIVHDQTEYDRLFRSGRFATIIRMYEDDRKAPGE